MLTFQLFLELTNEFGIRVFIDDGMSLDSLGSVCIAERTLSQLVGFGVGVIAYLSVSSSANMFSKDCAKWGDTYNRLDYDVSLGHLWKS
jgi:hypothetical protein